jgi:hypothetical protein
MLNPQRVVAKRVSKLLVLSLMVPSSVFAAEVSPVVPHNVAAVSQNNVQAVDSNIVLPQSSTNARKAPLTTGSVDWSSLNNQHLLSTKMLCGDTELQAIHLCPQRGGHGWVDQEPSLSTPV